MQVSANMSAASVIFGFILSFFIFVDFVDSLPMQQLGMFNMFQFHHGNKIGVSAYDRARRATRVRHHRESPRHARHTLESTKDLALCKYEVFQDTVPLRIPQTIISIRCSEKEDCDCKNKGEGTYRCTQLYTKISVEYLNADGTKNKEESIPVDYGCVCAAETGVKTQEGQEKR